VLIAAAGSERWIEAHAERIIVRERLAWWQVPLLAWVVFLIAGGSSAPCVARWACCRSSCRCFSCSSVG
jgi:hypothetical protein